MLASDRTAKYFEALNREGAKFDYHKWLQNVREHEAQTKRFWVGPTSGEPAHVETGNLNTASAPRAALMNWEPPVRAGEVVARKAAQRADNEPRGENPESRLRRRLLRISDAWDDFQASRARDAVYHFLEAVFAIVVHYKVRRRTKRLLRHAFRYAGLPFDKNANPFVVVIRSTSGGEVDSKTASKWSRALRYAAYSDVPRAELKAFMKKAGGVNASADRYARY
jgi:RNase P protein component